MDKQVAFVRSENLPPQPPPPSEVGVTGWIYHNLLLGMIDFSSLVSAIRSVFMVLFSLSLFYVGVTQLWGVLDFTLFSAVWSDPDVNKRTVCLTIEQGGSLPNDWHGACWPFVIAKSKFLFYGAYPSTELWRVNLVGLVGLIGLGYALFERFPKRGHVGILMLTIYPVFALFLLSGGGFDVNYNQVIVYILLALGLITLARMGDKGIFGKTFKDLTKFFSAAGWVLVTYAMLLAVIGVDVGLEHTETREWGGLLTTLVVAITGIVASLPLGILLALGRRSSMPVTRLICTIFVEFWRGVPLITVLFMASVMLPLFMPEGVNFDNLLRALIGVMLFSAAYMAEVVRGGLQGMDKGQYEGADAIGLSYWQSMRLVILPQALTYVIPGIVNTFIGLFKDTTLVSIVGLFDLLGAMQSAVNDSSWASPVQALSGYFVIALIFFFFCFGMSRYSMYMERKLARGRTH